MNIILQNYKNIIEKIIKDAISSKLYFNNLNSNNILTINEQILNFSFLESKDYFIQQKSSFQSLQIFLILLTFLLFSLFYPKFFTLI